MRKLLGKDNFVCCYFVAMGNLTVLGSFFLSRYWVFASGDCSYSNCYVTPELLHLRTPFVSPMHRNIWFFNCLLNSEIVVVFFFIIIVCGGGGYGGCILNDVIIISGFLYDVLHNLSRNLVIISW